ncbi:MAG: bifunctional oligoribonuclease/PAP phosphatase NrnA [Candidatus Omnitrophica bacterium]|nr:bifunctional oligoribonuclease/PAP phosphatase NrnA [Candidatus Omnitrophota bacterium]
MDELKFLSNYRSFFITSHLSPDGDAIGSEIALYFFLKAKGKQAVIVNDEPVPAGYRFLEGSEIIQPLADFKRRPRFRDSFEAAVFLECSSKYRAGQSGKIAEDVPILNIDHHIDNSLYGNVNLVSPGVSACGEIVHDVIIQSGGKITPEIASALYTAILTDTSAFRFNTNAQTLRITADLIDSGAEPNKIVEGVYEQVLFATLLLLGKVLSTIKQTPDGYVVYCKINRQMYQETGTSECDSESFIDYLRVVENNRVTFLLKELPDGKTRVNLRSKNAYDVQKVAAEFGGGGHRNAAGCTINTGLEESERLILAEIKKIL